MEWFENMARSIDKGNRLPKNDGISINNGNLSCKSVMNSFYHCAFSQTPSERDDELKVFRVFIGRRSFVKAFLYIQEHQIDEKICETVYSDVGFRVLAAKLGAEFVKAFTEKQIDNFFNNRTLTDWLFHDNVSFSHIFHNRFVFFFAFIGVKCA